MGFDGHSTSGSSNRGEKSAKDERVTERNSMLERHGCALTLHTRRVRESNFSNSCPNYTQIGDSF